MRLSNLWPLFGHRDQQINGGGRAAFPDLELRQRQSRLIETRIEFYRFVQAAFGRVYRIAPIGQARILGGGEQIRECKSVSDLRIAGIGAAEIRELRMPSQNTAS